MISIRNVSHFYGRYQALQDISFEVGKGEVVAFLGPNGAGKTTTMRILTGFMPPTYGEVRINGLDVYEDSDEVKRMIGYLPENPPIYPELTVTEQIAFAAGLKKMPAPAVKPAVDRAIELTGLTERRNTLISFLSKGLRQRVGIAQAIVHSPRVLVLDEPTIGLDPLQVVDIRKLIRGLSGDEERTVILSTHILSEASEVCKKAVIINNGRILAVESIDSLRREHAAQNLVRARVLRLHEEAAAALRSLPGIENVTAHGDMLEISSAHDVRESVSRTLVGMEAGLVELSQSSGSLEEIFLKLVK